MVLNVSLSKDTFAHGMWLTFATYSSAFTLTYAQCSKEKCLKPVKASKSCLHRAVAGSQSYLQIQRMAFTQTHTPKIFYSSDFFLIFDVEVHHNTAWMDIERTLQSRSTFWFISACSLCEYFCQKTQWCLYFLLLYELYLLWNRVYHCFWWQMLYGRVAVWVKAPGGAH